LLVSHHLLVFYFLAESSHFLQRRLFFPEILIEQLRNFGVLHLTRLLDQRLILTNLVSFGLNCRTYMENIENVFGGIFFHESFFLFNDSPYALTFAVLRLFPEQLKTLLQR